MLLRSFDEATQKFRQLDGVKPHRPIHPPQTEPLPTSVIEAQLFIPVYAEVNLSYTRQGDGIEVYYFEYALRKVLIAAVRSS